MKTSILLGLFLAASSQAQEKVNCMDESKKWSVSFQLEGKQISQLTFIHQNEIIATYSETLVASTSRWFGKTIYETSLGGARYFDFERKKNNPSFEASFLLINNPLGFETIVNCTAR